MSWKRTHRDKQLVKKIFWIKDNPRNQARMRKNRKICSCPMCGNPRKHFGELTNQELRFIDKYNQEIEDYATNND